MGRAGVVWQGRHWLAIDSARSTHSDPGHLGMWCLMCIMGWYDVVRYGYGLVGSGVWIRLLAAYTNSFEFPEEFK